MSRTTVTPAKAATATARSTAVAAVLAWMVPGLGHWYLGCRDRAIIFFVTIVVTFWGGVALGGVRSTMNIRENQAWFAAQLCAGPQSIVALMWSRSVPSSLATEASYPAVDIAVVYTGIAGLLNLLVLIDAISRAEADPAPSGASTRSPPRGASP